MTSKIIALICAFLSVLAWVIIYSNPPTDSDGGPMMAHNILFFYPLVTLSGVLSTITIVISIKNFIKTKSIKNWLLLTSSLLALPGLILSIILIRGIMTMILFLTA
jgi:hypothetical protein